MKNQYRIEHKIYTLAENALMNDEGEPSGFIIDDILFKHWDFSHMHGFTDDAWIATAKVEAENYRDAFKIFRKKMSAVIHRLAFITQCYIEYINEPFLIHRIDSEFAFFRYVEDDHAVGLMFLEPERKALEILMADKTIPERFYWYWNDAVNSAGYSSKLSLMFSAIDVLTKKPNTKRDEEDWKRVNEILGEELATALYGTSKVSSSGLRHRLVHGDYFGFQDEGRNYFEEVHKKFVEYFNRVLFRSNLISEEVKNPQRHPFGNKRGSGSFIKLNDASQKPYLKNLILDTKENSFRTPKTYTHDFDDSLVSSY